MPQMEVFFDYACPYCMRAHESLIELAPKYPQIEIIWCPCESHPRPERYGMHSDLCIRGMFFARDAGADLWEYHRRIYNAIFKDRANLEDIDILCECVRRLLHTDMLRQALLSGEYQTELAEANSHAYDQSGVWVVPAYRLNGRKLDAAEDVGVAKKQLAAFMDAAFGKPETL